MNDAADPSATVGVTACTATVTPAPAGSETARLAADGAPTSTVPFVVLTPLSVTRIVSSGSITLSLSVVISIGAELAPAATVTLPPGAV